MKRFVHRLTSDELQNYPIIDLVKGWFFKVEEISPGIYLVEGVNSWGRSVSRTGTNPEKLLNACKNDALEMLSKK